MVWGQKSKFFLLIILHGVLCNGVFDAKCNRGAGPCGETVTVICTLTHPLGKIVLQPKNESVCDMLTNEKLPTKDEKISFECTEHVVKMTIFKVKFSDNKYRLDMYAREKAKGYNKGIIIGIDVSGICEPEISKVYSTKELKCEAESDKDALIVWMDGHRKIYPGTRTNETEQFSIGSKFQSFLKLTEEMEDNSICCSVSYRIDGVYKESCLPGTSAFATEHSSSKNTTVTVVISLLVVGLVVPVVYLFTRKNRIINRARSLSHGPIVEQEKPEEENTTQPPLLPPV